MGEGTWVSAKTSHAFCGNGLTTIRTLPGDTQQVALLQKARQTKTSTSVK